jgi:hypothetical protein
VAVAVGARVAVGNGVGVAVGVRVAIAGGSLVIVGVWVGIFIADGVGIAGCQVLQLLPAPLMK